jgi:hypothetical protein
MGKRYLTFFLLVLFTMPLLAQTAKYSNEFLSIGVGARSLGLSNATVANVNDVTSGYWNPAGLTSIENSIDASLMHAEYFAGIAKYDYAGAAMDLDTNSWLGATFIRFGVDDIPNTTDLIDKDGNIDYGRISKFSAADYAFMISYARKSPIPNLSYGASVKVIYRNIGQFANAWGFGLDAGLQYQKNNWRFGLLARDITSTFNAWSFNEEELLVEVQDSIFNFAPENALEITLPKVLLGVSRNFVIYNDFSAMVELDADFTFDGQRHVLIESDPVSIDPHLGIEIDYRKLVFVRFGVGNFQRIKNFDRSKSLTLQPNFGIGINIYGFSIDYALTDIGDQSIALYSNIFSLRYTFDRKSR